MRKSESLGAAFREMERLAGELLELLEPVEEKIEEINILRHACGLPKIKTNILFRPRRRRPPRRRPRK